MFDHDRPGSIFAAVSPPADVAASPAEPARVRALTRIGVSAETPAAADQPAAGAPAADAEAAGHPAASAPAVRTSSELADGLVAVANARNDEGKEADQEQAQEAVFRPKSWGGDFSATVDYIRRYYEEHPAA